MDSGGFSELSLYGRWVTPPEVYAEEVYRWGSTVGMLDWAAIQDWMCEPFLVSKTGLSVVEHQRRTIQSWHDLQRIAPELPWIPIVQGWGEGDYWAHVEMWLAEGVDLRDFGTVGIGSVCRREGTLEAVDIIAGLSRYGISLHGFGLKTTGLARLGKILKSADSLAWSFAGRKRPLPDCTHKNCSNCIRFAKAWHEQVLRRCEEAPEQVYYQMKLPI